jgi:hypothetical protein
VALIRLYPEEVRRRYADEMVGYFGDLCREEWHSGGAKGMALLWARTLPDLVFSVLKERGTNFLRGAYLPVEPGTAARWGSRGDRPREGGELESTDGRRRSGCCGGLRPAANG